MKDSDSRVLEVDDHLPDPGSRPMTDPTPRAERIMRLRAQHYPEMCEDPDGEYVAAIDCDELKARIAELEAQLEAALAEVPYCRLCGEENEFAELEAQLDDDEWVIFDATRAFQKLLSRVTWRADVRKAREQADG